jgi:hypothetical protein
LRGLFDTGCAAISSRARLTEVARDDRLTEVARDDRRVRLVYQLPASSTFLSEQISHQQSANSTFLSEQTSTSHQPNEQAGAA